MNVFVKGQTVHVQNRMQTTSFVLLHDQGYFADWPVFKPAFTPGQMLRLGVFEGKYLCDCQQEYPAEYFYKSRLSPEKPDPTHINCFKAKSRNPLSEWKAHGWINPQDPRGWFEWYCRFYLGRRTPDDHRQILRWLRFAPRWQGMVNKLGMQNVENRKVTRQALLQWAHDPLPDFSFATIDETVVEKLCRVLKKDPV